MFDDFGGAGFFARVLRHPLILFVYSILSQWYMIIVLGSLLVTYWVFKGLKDIGVIDKAQTILVQGIEQTKGVAQNCTPRIVNLADFWKCVSDPASSVYRPTQYDRTLQEDFQNGLNQVPVIPESHSQSGAPK